MSHPLTPDASPTDGRWQQVLAPGPDCLPIERLAEALTPAETAHVDGCARCQTERDLLAAFEADERVDGEGLAVPWITAQVQRRVAAEQRPAAPVAAPVVAPAVVPRRLPAWALMAASLAVVVGGALLLYAPGGPEGPEATAPVYRSAQVEVTTPTGDLDVAPDTLTWRAVDGAVDYEVRLLAVDGTVLWRVTTSSPTVPVPADARAAFLPARTVVWRVDAREAGGRVVATSGDLRTQVRAAGAPASGR